MENQQCKLLQSSNELVRWVTSFNSSQNNAISKDDKFLQSQQSRLTQTMTRKKYSMADYSSVSYLPRSNLIYTHIRSNSSTGQSVASFTDRTFICFHHKSNHPL